MRDERAMSPLGSSGRHPPQSATSRESSDPRFVSVNGSLVTDVLNRERTLRAILWISVAALALSPNLLPAMVSDHERLIICPAQVNGGK